MPNILNVNKIQKSYESLLFLLTNIKTKKQTKPIGRNLIRREKRAGYKKYL